MYRQGVVDYLCVSKEKIIIGNLNTAMIFGRDMQKGTHTGRTGGRSRCHSAESKTVYEFDS